MPKRTDMKSILIIGAGPIIIGQACEFDYSGAQACKALREEGLPRHPGQQQPGDDHDRPGHGRRHLHRAHHLAGGREASSPRSAARRDGCPTMGGQTALNCALDLHKPRRAGQVRRGDDRRQRARHREGRRPPEVQGRDDQHRPGLGQVSGIAHSLEEAWAVQKRITADIGGTGFPMVIRPSFTLGGTGGGIAYNPEEFETICKRGIDLSPTNELLIEES
jgi:carbamoyl-phosphate synthase large subunit